MSISCRVKLRLIVSLGMRNRNVRRSCENLSLVLRSVLLTPWGIRSRQSGSFSKEDEEEIGTSWLWWVFCSLASSSLINRRLMQGSKGSTVSSQGGEGRVSSPQERTSFLVVHSCERKRKSVVVLACIALFLSLPPSHCFCRVVILY